MFGKVLLKTVTFATDIRNIHFRSEFLTKYLYKFLVSPVYATYRTHPIICDLITPKVFDIKNKPYS
jgi:hypothetical protein